VAHEGEGRALVITVEGKLEVVKKIDGVERFVAHRLPGTLFGEVPIALNGVFMASLRAVEPSRVILIEPKVFHTLAAAAPQVATAVGAAALERIGGLQDLARKTPGSELIVIGPRAQPEVTAVRTFLHRNQVEFELRAPPEDERAQRYPIVRLPDGTQLTAPSIQAVATAVGLSNTPKHAAYDVVIIGGGPAGMAAAVYAASEGLLALLIEREAPGGQAGTSSRIENYLGFPFGVSGDELATRALQQARRLGAEIVVTRSVERIDVAARTLVLDGGATICARALVLALGVAWRRLAIDSLDRLSGAGVYYGASRSEAGATHGRDIFLIGAGNSAGQAALFFANHARSVTLVVRGGALAKSMSHYLVRQLETKSNIRVALHSEITAVHGREQLEAVDIADRRNATEQRHAAGGLFVFIGADAATDWLPAEIARDERGYVLTGADAASSGRFGAARAPHLLETTVPGVFAVGDIRAASVKRVASAVGDGSLAISFVRQYLEELGRD
jgi:thioredoxin reductase (NADPH)